MLAIHIIFFLHLLKINYSKKLEKKKWKLPFIKLWKFYEINFYMMIKIKYMIWFFKLFNYIILKVDQLEIDIIKKEGKNIM